jgi:dTDP-4-amino-4,6-dideoxygalactose transaminase
VLHSGVLSDFIGAPHENFYGGKEVLNLENLCKEYFNVEYAISVNSATSALYMAIGAAGIAPGDEVIVTPYSMCASATCALIYGGIPVFADIDSETFCITAKEIESKITSKTKAIVVVNLFGQAAELKKIKTLSQKHKLIMIEDCAQAPGAKHYNQHCGTFGDMGVFSFNCHKTIQTGEGGVLITSNPDLAYKCQLIRNHGESVVDSTDWLPKDLTNHIGWNYRLTELQAAIAQEQFKKLDSFNQKRQENIGYLSDKLQHYQCFTIPNIPHENEHVYYLQALLYNTQKIGISRSQFINALKAEGIDFAEGYVKPIYLLPVFQNKIAFGKNYPFSFSENPLNYSKGICPTAEILYEKKIITHFLFHEYLNKEDLNDVVNAIEKVSDLAIALIHD